MKYSPMRGAVVGGLVGVVVGFVLAYVIAKQPNPGAGSPDEALEFAFYGFVLVWPTTVVISILLGALIALKRRQ